MVMQDKSMTVAELLCEIQSGFSPEFTPSRAYLLSEYNMLIRFLYLRNGAESVKSETPVNGCIAADLLPEQILRVCIGEQQLLAASRSLYDLMEGEGVYAATAQGLLVAGAGPYTVYYRALPEAVTEETVETEIPLDLRHLPLVRAWMLHRAYLYLADFDSADAYGAEYNRLLALCTPENEVCA